MKLTSSAEINIICDYCGKNIVTKYRDYTTNKNKSYLDTDACNECKKIKVKAAERQRAINRLLPEERIVEIKQSLEKADCEYVGHTFDVERKIQFICNKHRERGVQTVLPRLFNPYLLCKYCNSKRKSRGEFKICTLLTDKHIYFTDQYKTKDCRKINVLPFDFALFNDEGKTEVKCLIEYDGRHHYKESSRFGGISHLADVKTNDSIKNQYCLDNSIPLIRIPYWEFKNIEPILTDAISDPLSSLFLVKLG